MDRQATPAVTVTGLDHVVLVTPDVERSLAFYTGVLGLRPERVDEWRAGRAPFPSVRIDDGTLIDLMVGERTGENMLHLCFVIDDADLSALARDERLTPADGPHQGMFGARGMAASLYVQDPDGNTIELRCY